MIKPNCTCKKKGNISGTLFFLGIDWLQKKVGSNTTPKMWPIKLLKNNWMFKKVWLTLVNKYKIPKNWPVK